MGKGLGIAVLIVAAFAIIIPVYGIYLGLITAAIGIVVAVLKEKAFAVAIGALNILDAAFLSPSLKLAESGARLVHSSAVVQYQLIFWLWIGCGVASILVSIFAFRDPAAEKSVSASA